MAASERSNSSFRLTIGQNRRMPKRSKGQTGLDLHLIVVILKESSITELELHHQII